MKALLLNLLSYQLTDKNTGEVRSGINLNYISPDSEWDNLDYVGYFVSKLSVDEELVKKFRLNKIQYPATCELEFSAVPMPNGKSRIKLNDIKNITSLDIFTK